MHPDIIFRATGTAFVMGIFVGGLYIGFALVYPGLTGCLAKRVLNNIKT